MAWRIGIAGFVAGVLAILVAWLATQDVEPVRDAASATLAGIDRSEAAAAHLDAALAESPPMRRSAVDAASGAFEGPSGDLLVRVEWLDGTPASGVHVYLGTGGLKHPIAELVSDANGQVRARVPAGPLQVACDRGRSTTAEVEPGRRSEATLTLRFGVDVEGVVRDADGAPVPRARIWSTMANPSWSTTLNPLWCSGAFVATADERGAFVVRAAGNGAMLAAVAPGFAASRALPCTPDSTGPGPQRVDLVLGEPGGGIEGRIVDPRGDGVGGAMVAVTVATEDAGIGTASAPRRARTADDGHYAIAGLAPGRYQVEVWAPRFANASGACEVRANEVTQLALALERGVTVYGAVFDEDGNAVWRALVRAMPAANPSPFEVFAAPEVVTNIEGRFHLERLPAGELRLRAAPTRFRKSRTVPFAEVVMHAEPGAVYEWNARFDAGATIRGVARWRDGSPMSNASIVLSAANGEQQHVSSDGSGRFRFVRLARQAFDVEVRASTWSSDDDPVVARGVWPGTGELELRAAVDPPRKVVTGSVSGSVVDAGRRIAPGTGCIAIESGGRQLSRTLTDGPPFRFDDVVPGRTRIVVMSGIDVVHLGAWFELQPGEHKDLGALFTEPGGALHVDIDRRAGTEDALGSFELVRTDEPRGRRADLTGTRRDVRFDNLSAGEYVLTANAPGVWAKPVSCTVVAGSVATARVELLPAVERYFVIEGTAQWKRLRIVRDDGQVMADIEPSTHGPGPIVASTLPLGRFTVLAETEGGGKAETTFEMTSLAENQPPVVLQAK